MEKGDRTKQRNKKTLYPNRVMYRCSNKQLEQLKKISEKENITISQVTRLLVDNSLETLIKLGFIE